MENNAPTAAGPTPDSEDNNNGSEKESPSPRIIESTTTENVAENEGIKDEQTTPDSAVDGVTNETSDGVTIESKPPEGEDSVSPEEREKPEVVEETMGNEDENQGEKTNEENEGADERQREEKPSEPQTETGTEVPVEETEKTEGTSETKVEAASEEKAEVEDEEKVNAALDPATGTVPEPEREKMTVEDGVDQEKEENAEALQGFETTGEDRGDESQEESRQENNDTSSSVTKVEEGYSADNEATTTMASIDTGEPSQSGSVFEPKDEAEGKSGEFSGDKSNAEEKVGDEKDKKDGEHQEGEKPPMNYEELLTKYHATELQLDGLRDENKELEDKIKDLHNQIKEFNEGREHDKQKQRDGYMVQADFLARELSQTQDAEKFLKEKVAELLEEKEESEKKVRDLQLRLKRFSKDDKAKDERIAKMETELKEITDEVQELETYLDEETKVKIRQKRSSTRGSTVSAENSHTKVTDMNKMNTNRSHRDPEPVQRSRTCSII